MRIWGERGCRLGTGCQRRRGNLTVGGGRLSGQRVRRPRAARASFIASNERVARRVDEATKDNHDAIVDHAGRSRRTHHAPPAHRPACPRALYTLLQDRLGFATTFQKTQRSLLRGQLETQTPPCNPSPLLPSSSSSFPRLSTGAHDLP